MNMIPNQCVCLPEGKWVEGENDLDAVYYLLLLSLEADTRKFSFVINKKKKWVGATDG